MLSTTPCHSILPHATPAIPYHPPCCPLPFPAAPSYEVSLTQDAEFEIREIGLQLRGRYRQFTPKDTYPTDSEQAYRCPIPRPYAHRCPIPRPYPYRCPVRLPLSHP